MTNKLRIQVKRMIALTLVITLLLPTIAFGGEGSSIEDNPWLNLSEIAPPEISGQSEAKFSSTSSMSNHTFDMAGRGLFADGFPDTLPEYIPIHVNELTEFPFGAHVGVRENLMSFRSFQSFQSLESDYPFNEIHNLHDIHHQDTYTHDYTCELTRVIAAGLFSYNEAQILQELMPSAYVRRWEIARFERFVQMFNLTDRELDSATQMFLQNHSVSEIESAFALGAVLQVEPQMFLLPPGEYRALLNLQLFGYTSPSALSVRIDVAVQEAVQPPLQWSSSSGFGEVHHGPMPFDFGAVPQMQMFNSFNGRQIPPPPPLLPTILPQTSSRQSIPQAMQYPFDVEAVLRIAGISYDELDDIVAEGLATLGMNVVTPVMASDNMHSDIVSNPFNLRFNANESVNLNTGAAEFRMNILNIPGRNGMDLVLDLVYDSSRSDLYTLNAHGPQSVLNGGRDGLGVGWSFDLPRSRSGRFIIIPGVPVFAGQYVYLPGRGSFPLHPYNVNEFLYHTLQDIRLANGGDFVSGLHHSASRVDIYNGISYFFDIYGRFIGKRDRLGNAIRFEYTAVAPFGWTQGISRIVDSSGREIRFQYNTSGSAGSMTITDSAGGSHIINMLRIPGRTAFQVDSVQNPVGAVTSFDHEAVRYYFNFWYKELDRGSSFAESSYALLLRQVNYPSGAVMRFDYGGTLVNLGVQGSRHAFTTAAHTLLGHTVEHGWREYSRTSFGYLRNHTGWPSLPPRRDHTYSTTVFQNNGLSTTYNFNREHMNTSQVTGNGGVRLSTKTITYNEDRLPIHINLTEYRGGHTRNTQTRFTYNRYGQILTAVSPLAMGSTTPHQRYVTTYTYDSRYGLPLTRTFMTDTNTTIQERNTLSADGRNIIRIYAEYPRDSAKWQPIRLRNQQPNHVE